jgi:MoxR-like ATPase
MNPDIAAITEQVREESHKFQLIITEVEKRIVGQRRLLERLLIALVTSGHILLEGVPGLAKTTAIKTLAEALDLDFGRVQFTPDLLPADLTGTMIFNPKTTDFSTKKGPIFTNLLLADEINRAPAKVQSALLEAMQELQVTIGEATHALPRPFLVMATQNPIEQEGTYALPEAQVDRFMMKVLMDYPSPDEELSIINRNTSDIPAPIRKVCSAADLAALTKVFKLIYIDEKVKQYIVNLVFATRDPSGYGIPKLTPLIRFGASPRASIFLTQCAKAIAFLRGRGYVTPEDVKAIGPDVLRHRIILTYEAEAEELSSDDLIRSIFDHVAVP